MKQATSMASIEMPANRRLISCSARESRWSMEIAVAPPVACSDERLLGELEHLRATLGARREILPGGVARQRAPVLDGRRRQVERLAAGLLVDRGHLLVVGAG